VGATVAVAVGSGADGLVGLGGAGGIEAVARGKVVVGAVRGIGVVETAVGKGASAPHAVKSSMIKHSVPPWNRGGCIIFLPPLLALLYVAQECFDDVSLSEQRS
jgi:hypothetical protein